MKFIFLLIVFLSFPVQTFAQSNDPLRPCRTYYDIENGRHFEDTRTMEMLPVEAYPWGVCFYYYDTLTKKERMWTWEAMNIWNSGYLEYLWRRFKTDDVVNIPSEELFVLSCDSDKMNILYIDTEPLDTIGVHIPMDYWWDFSDFHGIVVMNNNIRWTREYFINVMVHELGHALGLPHAVPGDGSPSEFMKVRDFCDGYDKNKICKLKDYDFETFIAPFPGTPMTRAEAEQREWDKWGPPCYGPSHNGICF